MIASLCGNARPVPVRSGRGGGALRRHAGAFAARAADIWLGAVDLVYPRRCCHCGGGVVETEGHLCWECRTGIDYVGDPFCALCGDPVEGVVHHRFVCSWCARARPAFDRARSAARFRGCIKSALHALKYQNGTYLSRELGQMLAGAFAARYGDVSVDAVTCVPLHRLRERARTYNQSALLAGELARLIGRPCSPRLIERLRDTATQTHLSAHERRRNVRGAFVAARPDSVLNRRFLLVDDVMTTGATVDAASRALKQAGAAAVYVLTVARG